jgi:hypothetical protein
LGSVSPPQLVTEAILEKVVHSWAHPIIPLKQGKIYGQEKKVHRWRGKSNRQYAVLLHFAFMCL